MSRKKNRMKYLVVGLLVGLAIISIGSCTLPSPSYIRISNISGVYTIAHVNITGHNSGTWGSDLLTPDVITPGSSMSFGVNPGNVDVWITDTTPYDIYAYGVAVTPGYTTTLYFDGTTLAP